MGSEVTEEYRVQVFTPPYLQTSAPRPTITSAPATVSTAAMMIPTAGLSSADATLLGSRAGQFWLLNLMFC